MLCVCFHVARCCSVSHQLTVSVQQTGHFSFPPVFPLSLICRGSVLHPKQLSLVSFRFWFFCFFCKSLVSSCSRTGRNFALSFFHLELKGAASQTLTTEPESRVWTRDVTLFQAEIIRVFFSLTRRHREKTVSSTQSDKVVKSPATLLKRSQLLIYRIRRISLFSTLHIFNFIFLFLTFNDLF